MAAEAEGWGLMGFSPMTDPCSNIRCSECLKGDCAFSVQSNYKSMSPDVRTQGRAIRCLSEASPKPKMTWHIAIGVRGRSRILNLPNVMHWHCIASPTDSEDWHVGVW